MNTPNPIDLIERAYMAEPRECRFPLSGSSAGHCPRRLLRLLQGHPNEPDARSRRTFERGDQREESLASRLAQELTAQGYSCHRQLSVWATISTDHDLAAVVAEKVRWIRDCPIRALPESQDFHLIIQIRSHIDLAVIPGLGVMAQAPYNGALIFELKTANSFKFKSQKKGAAPEIDYLGQLGLQVEGLQHLYPNLGVHAEWIYESKDTDDLYVVEVDPAALRDATDLVRSRVENVLRAWCLATDDYAPAIWAEEKERTEPEHKGAIACLPWQCTYCPVGPIAGNCVEGFRVEGLPYKDKTKWELWTKE